MSRRTAVNNHAHVDADASQTIGLAGDHRTRGFPSHADGLGSVSSYFLSQLDSTVTSSGGRDILDYADQQAKVSVASAWSKPLRFAEASQPSNLKKDVLAKMPIRQSTQQCLQMIDPPIAQTKPAPKTGKKTEKKQKLFYEEVGEFRGPAHWEKKAQEDDGLLHRAQGNWRKEVGRKAAEYMRRRTAKKLKGKRCVSCKWMKKENQNRRAHQKKQAKREVFVKLNKVYKTKLRVEWRREINEELEKSRREQAILKSAGGNESYPMNGPKETGETISKARPSQKEAKKVRKANEEKARREAGRHDVRKSRRERAVLRSAGGRHESYPTNGTKGKHFKVSSDAEGGEEIP